MQAKPLAITIIVFGVLAFVADAWIGQSTSTARVFEQSQVAPVPSRQALQADTVDVLLENHVNIVAEDSFEASRTVAQKLQDLALIARVKKKLFRASDLKTIRFYVQSENGDMVLSGKVPTEKEQRRALRIAQSVKGVRSVANEIEVIQKKSATFGSGSE